VLLCFIKPILGNRYVRCRGFIVNEPRETHPRSEIADVPISSACTPRHQPCFSERPSDGTIRDIKIKYADAVANFDENAPLQWFGNILRQQQVLQFYRIGTTAIQAMEDAVHRILACTGQSSGFSIETATWRITTAPSKRLGPF